MNTKISAENSPSTIFKSTIYHLHKTDDYYAIIPHHLLQESGFCINDRFSIEVKDKTMVLTPMVPVSRLHREKRKYARRLTNSDLKFDVFRGNKCISKLVPHNTMAENIILIETILSR